ncbi:MAG: radical SAM family heme chaperone HemW [Ruminococcus sp.]|nr:radical SAM family heme chaperone HemW [Ruminococcus sp.]
MTGLYFHIPFCAKKCPYCDFFSVPYHKETTLQYVAAIIRNLAAYAPEDMVDTVYFGGGTPSLLSAAQIGEILNACAKYAHLDENPEITLEFNPTGERTQYLHDLRAAGVNRLSIGTQSFSDAQLSLLGRTHRSADGVRTVMTAYEQGFENISCDLMLACPHQSEEVLAQTLQILGELPITHVSAYLLQVEAGTPLSQNADLLAHLPDDDASIDRYLQTVHTLAEYGFQQYEVSSFAKPGYESRHNTKYWKCEPYLGIGAGAHSCYGGRRFQVPKDISAFCDAPVQPIEILDESPCSREEKLMLSLRMTTGVPISSLNKRAQEKLPVLERAGYVVLQDHTNAALTPKGFAVSNAVIAMLLE